MTTPCRSSMSRRSESVLGLMPGHACSSCMKRRGAFGKVVNDERRPLGGDDLRACGDRAALVVCLVHRSFHERHPTPPHGRQLSKGKWPAQALNRVRRAIPAPRSAAAPALVDRPDDQRLAATRVAGGEDAVAARWRSRVAATLPRASRSTPSSSRSALLGAEEAHREQHELGRPRLLRARDEVERRRRRVFCCQRSARPSRRLRSAVVEIEKSRSPPSFSA